MNKLTPEQLSVVHHPLDQHARVLAVVGSGKSTTMAQTFYLTEIKKSHGVIRSLMALIEPVPNRPPHDFLRKNVYWG